MRVSINNNNNKNKSARAICSIPGMAFWKAWMKNCLFLVGAGRSQALRPLPVLHLSLICQATGWMIKQKSEANELWISLRHRAKQGAGAELARNWPRWSGDRAACGQNPSPGCICFPGWPLSISITSVLCCAAHQRPAGHSSVFLTVLRISGMN